MQQLTEEQRQDLDIFFKARNRLLSSPLREVSNREAPMPVPSLSFSVPERREVRYRTAFGELIESCDRLTENCDDEEARTKAVKAAETINEIVSIQPGLAQREDVDTLKDAAGKLQPNDAMTDLILALVEILKRLFPSAGPRP